MVRYTGPEKGRRTSGKGAIVNRFQRLTMAYKSFL